MISKTTLQTFILGTALFVLPNGLMAQLNGTTYTIDKTSSASSTNYRSFQAFANDLAGITRGDGGSANGPGVGGNVTVTVVPNTGPYTEQVTLRAASGASANRRITINGNGQELNFSPDVTDRFIVRFEGAKFYVLQNLVIKSTNNTYGWGIHMWQQSDDNIIENVEIDLSSCNTTTVANSVGLIINASTTVVGQSAGANGYRNIVRNCYIHGGANGGPGYGINVSGTSGVLSNNQFINNRIEDFYSHGIYTHAIGGTIFKGNVISRPNRISTTTTMGFYNINSQNPDNVLEENIITNMFGGAASSTSAFYGFYNTSSNVPANRTWIYRNNIITNVNGRGTRYGFYTTYIQQGAYYHNTISFDDNLTTSGAGTYYGGYFYEGLSTTQSLFFRNNIISITKPTSGATYGLYLRADNQVLQVDYNVYNLRSASNVYIAQDATLGVFSSLASWQSSRNVDINSVEQNPNFVDPDNLNVRPQNNFINNIAPYISIVPRDFYGQLRNSLSGVDPGAIEFGGDAEIVYGSIPIKAYCSGDEADVEVKVKNHGPLNFEQLIFRVDINNGQISYLDTVVIQLLDQEEKVFNLSRKLPLLGGGTKNVGVYFFAPDDDPSNDSAFFATFVSLPPRNVSFSKGSQFNGQYNLGVTGNEDVISYNDVFKYTFNSPTGYSNSSHGTTWSTTLELLDGTTPVSGATLINPGSSDGEISINLASALSEKYLTIRLVVSDIGTTNCDTFFAREIYVAPRPVVNFDFTGICEGETVQFINNTTISSGTVSFLWTLGDQSPDQTGVGPSHVYNNFGSYEVRLIATSNFGFADSMKKIVTITESPKPDFSFTTVCEGTQTDFKNLTQMQTSATVVYTWTLGDGSVSQLENPVNNYSEPGIYNVKLHAIANGVCEGEISRTVNVLPIPTANFDEQSVMCQYNSMDLINQSTIKYSEMGYSWFVNSKDLQLFDANPSIYFDESGFQEITLVVTSEFGCIDSISKIVSIIPGAAADFTTTDPCQGKDIVFQNTSALPAGVPPLYEWTIESQKINTENVVYKFPNVGMKNILLNVKLPNGCESKIEREVGVGYRPDANFDIADVCEGEVIAPADMTKLDFGNVGYKWDMGDGSEYYIRAPRHTYNSAGSKTITLFASDWMNVCHDTIQKVININETPSCNFQVVSTFVNGKSGFKFEPVITGMNYLWIFGDGNSSTEESPVHHYMLNGDYLVRLSVNSNESCHCNQSLDWSVSNVSTQELELQNGRLSVYPNPANDETAVNLNGLNNIQTLQLIDMTGKILHQASNGFTSDVYKLNLSGLSAGTYRVNVYTINGVYGNNIIVTR
jgi:PKD repeat protein